MRLLLRSALAGLTLLAFAAAPAHADSKGRFDVSAGSNARAHGDYSVNERAGDTRVWLMGQLNKNYVAGCDWVEIGGRKKLVEKCNTQGWFSFKGYLDYGILDSEAKVKVCHRYDGTTTCGTTKVRW
ncbi:hypothetical protein [Streptomyces sp. NPDC048349]|uniref:hypothetical protein n=1 Tax=Streptomyces sp. NPDC048349 TaxID=3155486 RepID=UPI00341784A2